MNLLQGGTDLKSKSRTQQAIDVSHDERYEMTRSFPALRDTYQRWAAELMMPDSPPVIRKGEVVPVPIQGELDDSALFIRNTLIEPDTPAIDASLQRTDLLQRAGALEAGIDASNSIGANNALEKMLAHQLGVCHVNALKLITEATAPKRYNDVNAELLMVKKINLAARLMDVYQKGMQTLSSTRNAGKQTITVKQVHVSGGQNVIADNVTTGGVTGRGEV